MAADSPGSPPDRITGEQFRDFFYSATALLEANVDAINSLNVFPVPDGDTGTNMYLTMQSVMNAAFQADYASAGDLSAVMARAAMMDARGNSGIILSQFFKGVAVALEDSAELGPREMVAALVEARDHSYKAVANPVEGTMLTVIDWMARSAQGMNVDEVSLEKMLVEITSAAREAVANTPTMLSVLRDAGVVDAGGQGLAVLFEGFQRAYTGEDLGLEVVPPPAGIGIEGHPGGVLEVFLTSTEEDLYGYCTQFIIEGDTLDMDAIRLQLTEVSQSTVVVGDETMVKVHAHAEDPGPMISVAVEHGQISQVSMQNMDEQRAEFATAHRSVGPVIGTSVGNTSAVSVVSVAWGEGLEELFLSLGSSRIMAAGDTMNPSVRQIVEAVEQAPSDTVIFLPNNKNIVPAADQATEATEKDLRVIPSRTIPQGIAAMLAFSPEHDVEECLSDMSEALGTVVSGEITTSQRSVMLNNVKAEEGQIIGLLDGELVAAGVSQSGVLIDMLRGADVADELITLYWGDGLEESAAADVASEVENAFPDAEVEVVYGGQPHYDYLVSIER